MGEALRELEIHAYSTVLKAFMAGPVDEWDREEIMTKLRELWHIDNDVHMETIRQLKQDPELQAIREGRSLGTRPSRVKSFKPGGQPSGLYQAPSMPIGPQREGAEAVELDSTPSSSQQPEVSSDSRARRAPRSKAVPKGGKGAGPVSPRQRQGGKAPKQQGGGLAPPGGLNRRASAPVRPLVPGGTPMMAMRAASTRHQRPSRPRSSSLSGVVEPRGFLGKRVWRLWPNENPPWVEGVVYEYDPDSDTYTILYDPNTDPESGHAETMEAQYAFANPDEYVLCEKIDFLTMPGSRRQYEKPTPDNPPPPQPISLLTGAPSKKRKSLAAPAKPVPQLAPFDPGYLAARLQLAGEEELAEMVVVLERREAQILAELAQLDTTAGVSDAELAKRAELERKLVELSDREYDIMVELAKLKDVEL